MELRKLTFIAVLFLVIAVGPLQAQVTATIRDIPGTSPVDAFDLIGMSSYRPAVVYTNDIYAMWWHGGGPGDSYGTGMSWDPSKIRCRDLDGVTTDADVVPYPGYPECNDRVFFGWKHLSCQVGGACGTNKNWNIWPGKSNYPGIDYTSSGGGALNPGLTPPTSVARWSTANALPNPYLPYQDYSYSPLVVKPSYTGAGGPGVVIANGRYFMAYDVSIIDGTKANWDVHRIAWASSADGANWTHHGIIIRDKSEETNPGAGLTIDALYFENNTFYMMVTSLQDSQIYLLKAPYKSTAPYYTGWLQPINTDASKNLTYATTPISPATPVTWAAAGRLFKDLSGYNTQAGVAKVYKSRYDTVNYRYVFLVDMAGALRVYTSPRLAMYQESYSNISINQSHVKPRGGYGWFPTFPFMGPDATYPRAYNPVTIFMGYAVLKPTDNSIGRAQLVLSGDIY